MCGCWRTLKAVTGDKSTPAEETPELLNVSPKRVQRDWKTAKVWLLHQLREENHYGA